MVPLVDKRIDSRRRDHGVLEVMTVVLFRLAADETLEDGDNGQEDEYCQEGDDAGDDDDGLVVSDDECAASYR